MQSLKAEPCVYMFVCLFVFVYVFSWVYAQPCKHLYFDMGGGKGCFPIKTRRNFSFQIGCDLCFKMDCD